MQSNMNSEIRTKVAEILSIDEDPTWTIEVSENLCLVSSKKEVIPRYPDLRGVVVDLDKKTVVVPCFGRITSVLTPMVHFENGLMKIEDMEGNPLELTSSNMSFSRGFEGPVLRIYKNNGKIYCSTNRRLDCTKSRWGTKKTFLEMFKELGGEKVFETAFDGDKKYSSHYLTFIVVHPDMLLCSKQSIGNGYLVFLGAKSCFSQETCPYPCEEVDWTTYKNWSKSEQSQVPFPTTTNLIDAQSVSTSGQPCFWPASLTLDEVNLHLLLGYGTKYSNDIRTGSGEFVIATCRMEDGKDGKDRLFRFVSPSYDHRLRIRNEDPNLLHQFYCLSSEAHCWDDSDYEAKFPWLEYEESKKQEAEEGCIMVWNRGKRAIAPDWQKKFRNIWKHFVLSVPLHRQKEVFGYYKQFFLNREILAEWLCSWYGKDTKQAEEVLSVRSRKLMQLALDYERKHNPKADLSLSKKNLEKNMKFLLSNERGSSLYMLWKNRKQYLRQEALNAQKEEPCTEPCTEQTTEQTTESRTQECNDTQGVECEDGVCML
jgi:hypothetical protein